MKSFSVNKNSWHYKLNVEMCKTNDTLKRGDYAVLYVESKDNFCSYWRMSMWSMFKVLAAATFFAVVAAGIITALYMIGSAFIFHTQQALITTGVAFSFLAVVAAITIILNWLADRNRKKINSIIYDGQTETSLTKAKYSSWKAGICLPVEFK